MSYEALNAILSVTKTSTDYYKELQQETLNQEFENASDVYTIQEEDLVTGIYKDVKVRLNKGITNVNLQLASYVKEDFKKILFQDLNHPLKLGQRFKFFNHTWIVIDLNTVASVNSVCTVRKCNCQVKFYDDTNTLITLDGIAFDPSRTNDGVQNNSLVTSVASMLDILVKYEPVSKKVKRDMRLIIDRRYWIISKVDGLNVGLLKIICKENYEDSVYDDLENGIADRWKHEVEPNYTFDIADLITVKNGSVTSFIYSIKNNGVTVTNPDMTVTIANTAVATYNSVTNVVSGLSVGTTTLTMVFHGLNGIDYTFNANVRVVLATTGDIVTYSILTNDSIIKNEDSFSVPMYVTKTYYAQKYINGDITDANYTVGYVLVGVTPSDVEITMNNGVIDVCNLSVSSGSINFTWTDTVTHIQCIKTINLIN